MASSKKDDVAGFAIDRVDMDNLLIKWFGGSYSDIIEWREKAKKWDWFENDKEMGETISQMVAKSEEWKDKATKWENIMSVYGLKPDFDLNPRKIDEYIEKAEKYDEIQDGNHTIITNDQFNTALKNRDKAEKWDSLCTNVNFIRNDTSGITTKELIFEWKDKARRWDDYAAPQALEKLIEKARKWDEFKKWYGIKEG